MTDVAERAFKFLESKVIRHVRTEAGVRRFKQPIGSIIINDGLLVGLTEISKPTSTGGVHLKGANGKEYDITPVKKAGRIHGYVSRERGTQKVIYNGPDQTAAYAYTAKHVQEEAGIDTSGPGRLPGSSGGGKQTFSRNQVVGAGDEIAAWSNTANDNGLPDLGTALVDIADRAETEHHDVRVMRYELEQLKKRKDLGVDVHLNGNDSDMTGQDIIDQAIAIAVSNGRLNKRFDEEKEKAYREAVLADAQATNNIPKPTQGNQLSAGQWVRSYDPKTGKRGKWFRVTDVGDQSVSGRSKLITGKDEEGNRVRLYRQGPRDKFETVNDPKTATLAPGEADDHARVAAEEARTPDSVTKPVQHWKKGDYVSFGETSGYVQDYTDRDDYSSVERRKNPVYKVDMSDDKAGQVNRRKVIVPKGTVSGSKPQADATPSHTTPKGGTQSYPNLKPAESEYDGYEKFTGNGEDFYVAREGRNWNAYDKDDNVIVTSTNRGGVLDILNVRAGEAKPATAHTPNGYSASRHPNLSEATSEYDGYDKFVGKNGKDYYVAQEHGLTIAYDKNDKEVARSADRGQLLDDLNQQSGPVSKPETPKATASTSNLTRLKTKYEGWSRYKTPDGKIVDLGQAVDDDGRWYATGPGGWDEIIADGDSRDEALAKLEAVVAPGKTPVSISPGNTDVVAVTPSVDVLRDRFKKGTASQRSIAGNAPSAEELERERIRRSVAKTGNGIDIKPGTAADAGQPSPLSQAQQAANAVNQRMRSGAVSTNAPQGTKIRDLDTGSTVVLRNGKPLKPADLEALNADGKRVGRSNRLVMTNNRNLYNRAQTLAGWEDPVAYNAVQDRATENYLNGATPAAAWKEAIETAEQSARAHGAGDHYMQEIYGQGKWQVGAPTPGGGRRQLFGVHNNEADARAEMGQRNTAARRAAVHSLPVTGKPLPPTAPENAPAASTARPDDAAIRSRVQQVTDPEVRQAEIQSNIVSAYRDLVNGPDTGDNWVSLTRLRPALASKGYTKAEIDEALVKLSRQPGINIVPESNQKVLTQADRDASLRLGGQDKHLIYMEGSVTGLPAGIPATPAVSKPKTATQALAVFKSLDKESAAKLAREDPAAFLEAMNEGGFGLEARKQERARMFESLRQNHAFSDLTAKQGAEDQARKMLARYQNLKFEAERLRENPGNLVSVLYSIRLDNQGMMGAEARKMMAIHNLLKREHGL